MSLNSQSDASALDSSALRAEVPSDHDGFVLVFDRTFQEHKLSIRQCPDGDEIICEPPLDKVPSSDSTNLVWFFKAPHLEVRKFIHYELVYSQEDPDRFIYCIVSIDEGPAMEWADRRGLDLEIDEMEAITEGRKIGLSLALATQLPGEETTITKKGETFEKVPLDVWDKMHLPYDKHCPFQNIYQKFGAKQELLENRVQLRILYQILTADRELGGAEMQINRYLASSYYPLTAFFALHCPDESVPRLTKEDLYGTSRLFSFWTDKIESIRGYYGEEVGFYFAFLSHYAKSLVPFSVLGVIYFIVQLSVGKVAVNAFVDLLMILIGIVWSTYMIEMWYRTEWNYRYQWGMLRLSELAVPRPEFEGKMELSTVDGEIVENYASYASHGCKVLCSASTVFFCMMIVLASVGGIFVIKNIHPGELGWSIFVGLINSAQIQVMNFVYIKIAIILNSWEDHRLQSDYDNFLAVKKIVFYCVNSFNSLIQTAFILPAFCNPKQTDCSDTAVMHSLRIQLATLFFGVVVTQNVFQLAFPPLMIFIREYMYDRAHKSDEQKAPLLEDGDKSGIGIEVESDTKEEESGDVSNAQSRPRVNKCVTDNTFQDCEVQSELQPMTPILDQMAEIIIPYGYVMLFVTVLPIMPLLAMLSTLIQLRVDLFNIIHSQRPLPREAPGIGVWKSVMGVFTVLAIFSNMAILSFRSNGIAGLFNGNQLYIFSFYFLGCIVLTAILFLIRTLIPDVPQRVSDAMERQEYLNKFLIVGSVKDHMDELKRRAGM